MTTSGIQHRPEAIVVGCGVSGLTTAIVLQRAGYRVRIHTREMPAETTSAIAAAIWFPYKTGPLEAVNRWSRETYEMLEALADDPETGVHMVEFTEFVQSEELAWWLDAIPAGAWRKANASELAEGQTLGFVMRVPMVETPIYLPYLLQTFRQGGGEIQLGEVQNLSDLRSVSEIVINCTGLGAKELAHDSTLYPIRGQLVKIAKKSGIPYVSADSMEGAASEEATYIFPRRNDIVLGGTAVAGDFSLEWDEALGDRLIARCKKLVPALGEVEILEKVVGLRPGRETIRLEYDGAVIHNYGHGGAGYTVSWGCANAVRELVNAL
jgi:D-amino-acid oxidase